LSERGKDKKQHIPYRFACLLACLLAGVEERRKRTSTVRTNTVARMLACLLACLPVYLLACLLAEIQN